MKDSEVMKPAPSPVSMDMCRKCGVLVVSHLGDKHVRWHRNLEILFNLRSDKDE